MLLRKLAFIIPLFTSMFAQAQLATVVYDPGRRTLNEGQPLPAETRWMLTGPVAERMTLAELQLFDRKDQKRLLFTGRWEQSEWSNEPRFLINVDEKLHGSREYTVVIAFFEPIPSEVSAEVADQLAASLSAYVDEQVEIRRGRTKLLKPVGQMMEEMNALVTKGISNYRTRLEMPFTGFSQLVEDKLDKLNDTKLSLSKFSVKRSEEEGKGDQRIEYAREHITAVKDVIAAEVRSHLARELMIMRDRVVMNDLVTEKVKNTIALNLGYGAIYNSGGTSDLSIGQAPYLGLSVPLGRWALKSKFLGNSSVSAGIFLQNTEDEYGAEVTGPLVDRPIYLAYGYRIFRMIRLNVGGALLQQDRTEPDGSTKSNIYARPFIGASLEINLWLGMGR